MGEADGKGDGDAEADADGCGRVSTNGVTPFGGLVAPLIVTVPLPLTAAGSIICALMPEVAPRLTHAFAETFELIVAVADDGGGVTGGGSDAAGSVDPGYPVPPVLIPSMLLHPATKAAAKNSPSVTTESLFRIRLPAW